MRRRNHFLLLIAILTLGFSTNSFAQGDKSKRPSPPAEAKATVGDLAISINYNSPAVKGRKIFGGLEPYDKVWRTGANEATIFEVNKDVMINDQKLSAGKYALFSIPTENGDWTVIFNKEANQWGAYNYKESEDVLRVKVKPGKTAALQERLDFKIDATNSVGKVIFSWENVTWSFDVKKA
ncbi:MAG: DUF2911 domain-containing protein [Saprospiraceae bacterium]|nr:DUF2911 domain-containing protein [Saprospiraceae bacterium]